MDEKSNNNYKINKSNNYSINNNINNKNNIDNKNINDKKDEDKIKRSFYKNIIYGFILTMLIFVIALIIFFNMHIFNVNPLLNFPVREIGFKTPTSNSINNYYVYIAATTPLQTQGYMNSSSLGNCDGKSPCLGMLFVFNKSQNICMWMKNTEIPLEQIWFNSNGEIVNETMATPYSTNLICNNGQYVLETNNALPANYILTGPS
ncbi:MAG: DUF192 domain-containing protein [Candidatus Micrarchaeia archaeon]